jgi:hypothetical protein
LRVEPNARLVWASGKDELSAVCEQLDGRRAVLETSHRGITKVSTPALPRTESATKMPLADGLVFPSKAGNKPSKDG